MLWELLCAYLEYTRSELISVFVKLQLHIQSGTQYIVIKAVHMHVKFSDRLQCYLATIF